jgi:hypothetical protein
VKTGVFAHNNACLAVEVAAASRAFDAQNIKLAERAIKRHVASLWAISECPEDFPTNPSGPDDPAL